MPSVRAASSRSSRAAERFPVHPIGASSGGPPSVRRPPRPRQSLRLGHLPGLGRVLVDRLGDHPRGHVAQEGVERLGERDEFGPERLVHASRRHLDHPAGVPLTPTPMGLKAVPAGEGEEELLLAGVRERGPRCEWGVERLDLLEPRTSAGHRLLGGGSLAGRRGAGMESLDAEEFLDEGTFVHRTRRLSGRSDDVRDDAVAPVAVSKRDG